MKAEMPDGAIAIFWPENPHRQVRCLFLDRSNTMKAMLVLALALLIFSAVVVLVHEIARYGMAVFIGVARRTPAAIIDSRIWARSQPVRLQLDRRFPVLFGFVSRRLETRRFTGLALTLALIAAIYLIALFSGLTEEILEAEGVIRFDHIVNAAFGAWRVDPLVSVFNWITALGASPAVVSAVIIATGFLWSQRRYHMVLPLWVTCLGAVSTTSLGKLIVARHRPEFVLDVVAPFSSFPSGHATASLAVYGFLAYAIARALPTASEKFEIAYWTAVLIGLIGLSRIALGVHYVTDILGGFLVGAFWLLIGFIIAAWTRPAAPEP